MFSYSTGYYVSPPDDQYLKFKNRCSLMRTAVFIGWDTAPPPPRFWAHIRGRYWSANIDDISLWPPDIATNNHCLNTVRRPPHLYTDIVSIPWWLACIGGHWQWKNGPTTDADNQKPTPNQGPTTTTNSDTWNKQSSLDKRHPTINH